MCLDAAGVDDGGRPVRTLLALTAAFGPHRSPGVFDRLRSATHTSDVQWSFLTEVTTDEAVAAMESMPGVLAASLQIELFLSPSMLTSSRTSIFDCGEHQDRAAVSETHQPHRPIPTARLDTWAETLTFIETNRPCHGALPRRVDGHADV